MNLLLEAIIYFAALAVTLYLLKHAFNFYLKEEEKAERREREKNWK